MKKIMRKVKMNYAHDFVLITLGFRSEIEIKKAHETVS
ncbi:hypothetical protein T190607A01A_30250 [Tenacibaculum sp. 190524A05c]|uniref:Uncharacterized protein n=1 Tax=Tenacibaculum platacis TaxID=3137852 RepID=A0ABM9P2Z3_9FLAO